MEVKGKYFYGNKISDYGLENGRVDYRTFAKSFDAVLNNGIMAATCDIGYWELVSGGYYADASGNTYTSEERDEKLEELENRVQELEADLSDIEERLEEETEENKRYEMQRDYDGTRDVLAAVYDDIEALEEWQLDEAYQWYIVDDNGARICEEAGEVLYYNEELDMYLWGVTHYGTAWDYVLTNIRCNTESE